MLTTLELTTLRERADRGELCVDAQALLGHLEELEDRLGDLVPRLRREVEGVAQMARVPRWCRHV